MNPRNTTSPEGPPAPSPGGPDRPGAAATGPGSCPACGGPTGNRRSPSRRIAAELRAQIAAGAFLVGEQLPTNTELRASYDVANQTAQNAIALLKAEGLVESLPGRGVFVRAVPDTPSAEPSRTFTVLWDLLDLFDEGIATVDRLCDAIAFIQFIQDRLDAIETHLDLDPADHTENPL